MAEPQTVAVVIVNYNRAAMLAECVRSVLAGTRTPDETIVVDNGSSDGSADRVAAEFKDRVRLVRLSENLGFAGGNNAGIKEAQSEWIALINNDALADPDWLRALLETAAADPGLGLVACRILHAGNRDLLDNLGVGLWPDGMSRGRHHFGRDADAPKAAPLLPSGCAMLIRRRAFLEVGGFDDGFFLYSEDTDLGIKVRLAGWKCGLADRAAVYHQSGGTWGVISPEKLYYVERNRLAVLFRYYPWTLIAASPLYTLARYAGLAASALHRRRRDIPGPGGPGTLLALGRAYVDGLRRLPADLRLRRQWKKRARVPAGAMPMWIKEQGLDWRSLIALEVP